MKRSNLALAVLTAIAVAACGGSSSNDDAPVDKKPETPAKPVKPTTPETGNTETPEEKTPETPETPAVAGGAGGAGGKTDTTKKDEKKPEAPAGGGHGGGKTKPKTADEAEALLIKAEADKTKKEAAFNDLDTKLTAANNALAKFTTDGKPTKINTLKAEKEAAKKAGNTFSQAKQAELDTLLSEQTELQKAVKTLTDAQEKANVAKEDAELKALDAKIDHLELTEPKSVVAVTKADKDLKQAEVDTRRARLTQSAAREESGKWAAEAKRIQGEINEAKEKAAELTRKNDLEGAKKVLAEAAPLETELANVNTKKATEDAKVEAAQKVIAAAEEVTEQAGKNKATAVKAAKIRGQEGDKATIAAGEGFEGIDFVVKDGEKWLITFKGDEKATELDLTNAVDLGTAADGKVNKDAPYGKFVFKEEAKDGKNEVTADYGLVILNSDSEEVATSAYGYVNDKFFHFGQLASVEKVKELNGTNYKGSAFVKTNEEKPRRLIADVEATAKFNDVPTPVLEGTFSGFQSYINADDGTKKLEGVNDIGGTNVKQALKFRALIKDNGFQASKEAPGDVKVYGNFYGVGDKEGKEIGGFVEHDDFYGSFGGKTE